ncbi:alpha/beta hydrolase [Weissella cibaria]|uniref:alpha/beta hydrolase n=1 Tax=Weissella cibaria TaxID=137591 RepID=UPI003CC883FD
MSVTEFVQQRYDDRVLPTVVFIHGGAFVGESVANVTPILRQMADAGALRVFALDYSLAWCARIGPCREARCVNRAGKSVRYTYQFWLQC